MAGIYIHIPFCRKACHYCNFHFSTSEKLTDAMIKAICREAEMRSNYINENITTIYFGGGTPSLLSVNNLKELMCTISDLFTITNDAEITLEANPDDINENKLNAWRELGINRLSIGVQSFFNEDLKWMNRVHNADEALKSILLAQKNGFDNITIDLIYGTPTLNEENWMKNLQTVFSLNIPHVSCYALTVEEKTALSAMIALGKIENIEHEKQSRHFELLMRQMKLNGYEHYEISNFAKPGNRSKHNSSYWNGKPYLGLGPSAHSYNGNARQWNIANNALYIKNIESEVVYYETENLTDKQKLNEYIMTSLRTMEGISLDYVLKNWDNKAVNKMKEVCKKFFEHGLVSEKNNSLILTDKGKLFADGIAADLFAE